MTEDSAIDKLRHFVVGANHLSSTALVRDRLFMEPDHVPGFLDRLRNAGLGQALLISTCARTEVMGADADPERAAGAVAGLLAERAGLSSAELAPQLYVKQDEDAVRHAFTVVASLDSPVIGEPQVTGQVRDSHRLAKTAGLVGRELDSVLSAAYGVAKRVRTETTVGERPVSMAAVAHTLARNVHGDLARCAGLLIVTGDMGELIAERLLAEGLGRMVATSPVDARAALTASRYGCHHAPMDTLASLVADADIVISSLGRGDYVVDAELVQGALAARRQRPIFLIDAAIPGDIHPDVDGLDGAFLYNLDDLERAAMQGRASRDAAAQAARGIVDDEVAGYFRGMAGRGAAPILSDLRTHFESVRASVLAERRGADPDEATRLLVNRLLHDPSEAIRRMTEDAEGDPAALDRLVRRLFGLPPATANDDSGGGEKD